MTTTQTIQGVHAPARRHPLEVTVDRMRDHYAAYYYLMTGAERDMLSRVAFVFEEIADGNRREAK